MVNEQQTNEPLKKFKYVERSLNMHTGEYEVWSEGIIEAKNLRTAKLRYTKKGLGTGSLFDENGKELAELFLELSGRFWWLNKS